MFHGFNADVMGLFVCMYELEQGCDDGFSAQAGGK